MYEMTRSDRRLLDAMQRNTDLSQIELAELSGKSRPPSGGASGNLKKVE